MDFVVSCFLDEHPEQALALRHAPPSRAWLAACRRCCGPEIFFAFFDDLSEEWEPDGAALASLLRRFQSNRITYGVQATGSQNVYNIRYGDRELIIVDGIGRASCRERV